jgi:ComF family protein
MKLFKGLLNSLFPDRCVGCGMRGALLCEACLKKVAPATASSHTFITSIFAYHDFRVKRLIWLLKYRNARHAAGIFAPALAGALTEFFGEEHSFLGTRDILLVPVPLSKKRMSTRGYNQAELLARAMLPYFSEEHISIDMGLLKKVRDTTPQADIKKKSVRLANMSGCFRTAPGRTGHGEVIILIDDVTTTGATLVAARRALRDAGFSRVYACTVAH